MIDVPSNATLRQRHFPNLNNGEVGGAAFLALAIEDLPGKARYSWNGLSRIAPPKRTVALFQYTISGMGCFEQGGKKMDIGPGMAFIAIIPSEHKYWLPSESPGWRFGWLTTSHSFVSHRIERLIGQEGACFAMAGNSPLSLLVKGLFAKARQEATPEPRALEAELLLWTLGVEQHLHDLHYPEELRSGLLDRVRDIVLEDLAHSIGVEEVAHEFSMTRSHFSHYFKTNTGVAPSHHIASVRLDAVMTRLQKGQANLKEIALQTGFADSNHLCKCFKRRFNISPGLYRRQIREQLRG